MSKNPEPQLYDFECSVDRRNTCSLKWDTLGSFFQDEDLLPLWVADMDFASPREVIDSIVERAQHGVYGYSIRPPSIDEAVIEWLGTQQNWETQKEWLCYVPGVVPAFSMLVLTFTHPGDKVIVQSPVYGPFFNSVLKNGRQALYNRLVLREGQYVMDFEGLIKSIDRLTKMIFLCSPHNPVGRVWTRDELVKLGEICLERDILIVSDEVHSGLVYESHQHIPFGALSPELAAKSITLVSATKTYNVAGIGSSVAVIPGEKVRDQFAVGMDRSGYSHVNTFGLIAMEAAFRHGGPWLEQVVRYLQGNRDYIAEFLSANLPQVKYIKPEGTYLAWLDFSGVELEPTVLNDLLVKKAKVLMNDGPNFGPGGEGFKRLNFACPRPVLREALERIARALSTAQ